jgi:hypothetical protein
MSRSAHRAEPIAAGPDWRPDPQGPRVRGAFVELDRGRWIRATAVVDVRVTADGSSPGRCTVLVPGASAAGVARRISCPYPPAQVIDALSHTTA